MLTLTHFCFHFHHDLLFNPTAVHPNVRDDDDSPHHHDRRTDWRQKVRRHQHADGGSDKVGSLVAAGLMSECLFDADYIETKQSAKVLCVDFLTFFVQ